MNQNDNYIWLEEVLDSRCLSWAKSENENTTNVLGQYPIFNDIKTKALEIYQNVDRILYVNLDGDFVYHLWTDEKNLQGLYRRQSLQDYLDQKNTWEVLLDLDALSQKENQKWVFREFDISDDKTRALVTLSPGGLDSNVVREFDLKTKTFIENGFYLPQSKGSANWVDNDTIMFHRDFGPETLTKSGYPRLVKECKRGEKIENAKTIFEVSAEDVWAYSFYTIHPETRKKTYLMGRGIDFYHHEQFLYEDGKLTKLTLPKMFDSHGGDGETMYFSFKEDWGEFKSQDIVLYDYKTHKCTLAYRPESGESVYAVNKVRSGFFAIIDRDVKGEMYFFEKTTSGFKKMLVDLPKNGTVDFLSTDVDQDKFFVSVSSYNLPASYFYGEKDKKEKLVKAGKSFFNHEDIKVEQHFVASTDGVKIPYFLVYHKDVVFDGTNPTILYGYGGFEIALKPNFNNTLGTSWLSRKGVYVLSNIRGGGEYGPEWHQCALKENRQKAYDDFFAIAEDLFKKNVTSPEHLGAMGGSNGGLLMGVCYTMRPDLFSAINCMVPLLDMHRYHLLLAGYSWVAEYGNPDDEKDGAYIRKISPYQNIQKNKKYPMIFVNTSTKDDRVHPGHARKFVAKLKEYGHQYYYYENIDGGHAGSSNFVEMAHKHAMDMCFFWKHLKK